MLIGVTKYLQMLLKLILNELFTFLKFWNAVFEGNDGETLLHRRILPVSNVK